jgi:hypothetical protein
MSGTGIATKLKTAFRQDGVFRLSSGLALGLLLAWHYAPSHGSTSAPPPQPQAAAHGTGAAAPTGQITGGAQTGPQKGPQAAPVSNVKAGSTTGSSGAPSVAAPVPTVSFPSAPSAPAHQKSSGAVIDGDAPIAR